MDYSVQCYPLLAKVNFALGDPGNVKKVIDKPGQVLNLPVDHISGFLLPVAHHMLLPKQVNCIENRSQGVS